MTKVRWPQATNRPISYELKLGLARRHRQRAEPLTAGCGTRRAFGRPAVGFSIDHAAAGTAVVEIEIEHAIGAPVLPDFGWRIDAPQVGVADQSRHLCRR